MHHDDHASDRKLVRVDCISFEVMHREHVREAVADDEYFRNEGFALP